MKKLLYVLMCTTFVFGLAGCGGGDDIDYTTPKSAELSKTYDYYEYSIKKIVNGMNVTPEQADEIFLALVEIGADDTIVNVFSSKEDDNTYSVRWTGSVGERDVDLIDGVVSEIRHGLNILYPYEKSTEYLEGKAIENAITLIEGLDDESSYSDYEEAQNAYDVLSKNQRKEISQDLVTALYRYGVSTMTLEVSIDSAIEKSGAEVERISINENLGTDAEGDYIVLLYLKGKDNISNKMIRTGMLEGTIDILKNLQPRQEISEIALFWSMPFIDTYGNTKEETVMKISLSGYMLQTINFDNFVRESIPDIAEDYFVHQAILD